MPGNNILAPAFRAADSRCMQLVCSWYGCCAWYGKAADNEVDHDGINFMVAPRHDGSVLALFRASARKKSLMCC